MLGHLACGRWEWRWVGWCRGVGSAGAVHAARHVGQAPWPARYLGLSGSQRSPGSRAAAGRRAAIAERPLGPEGRPGNLRGVNRTSTAVTGQDEVHPVLGVWPWTSDRW